MEEELRRAGGFLVGGWGGNHLWNIQLHRVPDLHHAVVDAPSMAKAIGGDALYEYVYEKETPPAHLSIKVSGCPPTLAAGGR